MKECQHYLFHHLCNAENIILNVNEENKDEKFVQITNKFIQVIKSSINENCNVDIIVSYFSAKSFAACLKHLFHCWDEIVNHEVINLDLKFRSIRELIEDYKNSNSYFVKSNSTLEMLKRLNEIEFN